ncbi:unnamed protein product [Sympodiomycopsis kandeliae]
MNSLLRKWSGVRNQIEVCVERHLLSSAFPIMADSIDYSLYLVTGRELLPPGVDYYESLEKALSTGQVTVVQVREKDADNGEFLEIAQRSLEICDRYSVPMFVNDNLSVAQCLPSRVGLHIGQDDIPIAEARRVLGSDRLVGISVHNVEQARQALSEGIADYAGVGPVYGTQSKAGITDDKVLSPRGTSNVIAALQDPATGKRLPSVLIGGINTQTAARSLVGSTSEHNYPDGIAVISAIVARTDPDVAARELYEIVAAYQERLQSSIDAKSSTPSQLSADELKSQAASFLASHREWAETNSPPLIQTLTSHVSSTMSANIALAFSSSPIMSQQYEEAEDLGMAVGGVVLNIGTINSDARKGMKAVGATANHNLRPIVLDPVGVGASKFRKGCVDTILNETQITLIKGNAAELSTIFGSNEIVSRGVDSGSGSLRDPIGLVKSLARREKALILLTGATDYLSDGEIVITNQNGHPLLGKVTGTGCALGVMLSAGMATSVNLNSDQAKDTRLTSLLVNAQHHQLLLGALIGLLTMTIASEKAAERQDVKGPGSFIPALIDEIANLTPQDILQRAKISVVA